jgi:hypothetical protein
MICEYLNQLGTGGHREYITFSKDYIASTWVHEKVSVLGTDCATALVDWIFGKWPL